MTPTSEVPMAPGRLEAFSDGVIAIIITLMVFDLKVQEGLTATTCWAEALKVLPKLGSYALSFLAVAIMWVNHHQAFQQIERVDRNLLWLNMHLLFWMSVVPFVTSLLGGNHRLPHASAAYGFVFFMIAASFTALRGYAVRRELLHETIRPESQRRIRRKNALSMTLYLASAAASYVSVYAAIALFVLVPCMYFVPERVVLHTRRDADG